MHIQMSGFIFMIGILTAFAANALWTFTKDDTSLSSVSLTRESGSVQNRDDEMAAQQFQLISSSLLLTTNKKEMDVVDVLITSHVDFDINVFSQSDICHLCPPERRSEIHSNENKSVSFDTRFDQSILLFNQSQTVCNLRYRFIDSGLYVLNITSSSSSSTDSFLVQCTITLLNSPRDGNIPVYIALSILVACFIIWRTLTLIYRRGYLHRFAFCFPHEQQINADLGWSPLVGGNPTGQEETNTRVKSVDTFRGISLVLMIFVNYGGGGYWYFQHSPWDGLTVADLVFPWFVFLMGTSVAMAFRGYLRRGTSRVIIILRALKRTVILFFLGLLISNNGVNVDAEHVRVFGVLQRLAVTYLIVALVETFNAQSLDQLVSTRWSFVRDLVPFWPTWVVFFLLLALHLCLTFLLPVPGCPTGYLGPGGLHDNSSHFNCTGGAAGYIDRLILGQDHMYARGTFKNIYGTVVAYDPEGILGIITSVLMCLLGLQAGKIQLIFQGPFRLCRRWIIWAIILGLIGGALCEFKQYDGWIPVNKNLWSLSYVCALSSMAFLLLTILYVLIDVYHWWDGAPFLFLGMNSIVIYMCHEVFINSFPVQFHVASKHLSQLAMDVWGAVFWTIISAVLYYNKIFISV